MYSVFFENVSEKFGSNGLTYYGDMNKVNGSLTLCPLYPLFTYEPGNPFDIYNLVQ